MSSPPDANSLEGVDSPAPSRALAWATYAALSLYAVVLLRTAWLSEDAYFTFRTVENFVEGHGLRWNVAERVQVYTHPLWMFVMSVAYALTRDMVVAAFGVSLLISQATMLALARVGSRNAHMTLLAVFIGLSSKALVEYSSSGLENPLSHLLLLLFFVRYFDGEKKSSDRELCVLAFLASLVALNRLDLGLVVAPALVHLLWRPEFSRRRLLPLILGFTPLLVWELFSIVYYGFPVPNTAYAKLGAGTPPEFLWAQAERYFSNSLAWDPITLVTIGVISLLSCWRWRSRARQASAALGCLLYLAYVAKIGGDYMSGRFFSAPLFVSLLLLSRLDTPPRGRVLVPAWIAVAVLAFAAPVPTLTSGKDYYDHKIPSEGKLVDDERGFRFYYAGLLGGSDLPVLQGDPWFEKGLEQRARADSLDATITVIDHNSGYMGFAAGPRVHIVNPYAITDPLLARLPARIGFIAPAHFMRHLPPGYVESVHGENLIVDPSLHAYWDDLSTVIRGPLWSRERWAAIWRLNSGGDKHLLNAYLTMTTTYGEVMAPDAPARPLRRRGAIVHLDTFHHDEVLEVSLERDDLYRVEAYRAGELRFERVVGRMDSDAHRLVVHRIGLPPALAAEGYDEIRVLPVDGNGYYRMSRLRTLTREEVAREEEMGVPLTEPAASPMTLPAQRVGDSGP
jgi:arabinofuranosyltransferase